MSKYKFGIMHLPIKTYLKWWLDKYAEVKEKIIVGISETNPAYLTNCLKRPLLKFILTGKTEQGENPSPDNPQEIRNVEGINKLAYSLASLKAINGGGIWNDNKYTFNGIEYTINDDLTVKVNGISSSTSYLLLNNDISLKQGENYILNGCPAGGGIQKHSIRLYDGNNYESQTGTDLSFVYGTQSIVRINVYGGITVDNLLFKPMISKEGGDYVPYNCIQIKKCNKNIFDLKQFLIDRGISYTENVDGSLTFTTGGGSQSLYSKPFQFSEENIIVSLSGIITSSVNTRIELLNSNNEYAGNITPSIDKSQNKSCCKLRLNWPTSDTVTMKNIMLNEGATAEDYIPHQEKTYNFPLSEGQKLMQGGTIENNVKNIKGQIVLDGSEDEGWRIQNSGTVNFFYQFVSISNRKGVASGVALNDYCNRFSRVGITSSNTVEGFTITSENAFRIRFGTEMTLANLRTWLLSNPITIEYELATPDETDFTTEQQAVIDEIIKDGTYKEVTHFEATASINPGLYIEYQKSKEE